MKAFPILLLASSVASAQAPRQLYLATEARIEAKWIKLERDPLVVIGPKAQIIVSTRFGWSGIGAYDSSAKPLWQVKTGRGDDVEIRAPAAIGWIGTSDTVWVSDVGYDHVALINGKGEVIKSIEYPTWLHPSWAERRKYPLFSRIEPHAVYRDQTMLVVPSRERALINTPGFDRSLIHLVRSTWDGRIERTVTRFAKDPRQLTVRTKGCNHVVGIPFAVRSFWGVSSDGSRIVAVDAGVTRSDSGTFRVTALNDRGDTVFTRRYAQPVVRTSEKAVEEFLEKLRPCGDATVQQMRDSVSKRIPPFRSLVTGQVVGRDQSVWVVMQAASDSSPDRTAMILDPRGDVIGTVLLPSGQTLVGADRDHLWTIEFARNRTPVALVRYKVTATRPRSTPAVGISKGSRPPS
jgi:hypothetical protein